MGEPNGGAVCQTNITGSDANTIKSLFFFHLIKQEYYKSKNVKLFFMITNLFFLKIFTANTHS